MQEKDLNVLNENQLEEFDPQEARLNLLLEIFNCDFHADKLRESLSDFHANDIAQILPVITKSQRLRLYAILSNEELSDIFSHLENPSDFIEEMSDEKVADIIEEMASDDAVDLLEELDEDKQKEIFELLDDEAQREVELITAYDDDLLGSLMSNDFVVINNTFSVKEAMNSLVKQAETVTNITTIYVTDKDGVFFGAIELKDLFIARASSPLENIIATSYPCFNANLKIAEVIDDLKEYSEQSLPIVDNDNRLIGVLTDESIIEALESEMEEDYSKLAGLTTSPEEEHGVLKNLGLRLPWLIVLLGLSVLVSALISTFDGVILALPLLAFFQPMILGMSGNTGTQALGVTIRNLSQASNRKSTARMFAKEISLAFINGVILAVISFVLLGLYVFFFKDMPIERAFVLSACIGIALLISMTVSGFCGCAVPVLFKKIGIDPASASGPLITTASDLVSALTYYGIISLLLNRLIG